MIREIRNEADIAALRKDLHVEKDGGRAAAEVVTTDLDFRVGQALTTGIEACYAPELMRCFATAYDRGFGNEANAAERKLKAKYGKNLNLTHFRAGVKALRTRQRWESEPDKSPDDWEAQLIRKPGSDGAPVLCERNALLYFENDPAWAGVLGYNEFTAEHAVLGDAPSPVDLKAGDHLKDHHDTLLACWLQVRTGQPWKVEMVRRAVDCFARNHTFHPVRNYLDGLPKWNPETDPERLKTWLRDYAGAGPSKDGDTAALDGNMTEQDKEDAKALEDFIAAAGERTMIGAVARVRNPGCDLHHVLVFEGGEGLGKSMFVKAIGKGWSLVMTGALDGKPAQELVASGVWIWELSELASLKKTSEVESVKAFITNPEDVFRPAYGRRPVRHKRQCAFIATVNGDQYLDSQAWEDGKRRIWPIRCVRPLDLTGLEKVIDLLWAEADYKYQHGYRWHFDREEDKALIATAKREQAARVPENVNQNTFVGAAMECVERLAGPFPGSASIEEIFQRLEIALEKRRGLRAECGKCLEAAGWKLTRPRDPDSGLQVRRYWPPPE